MPAPPKPVTPTRSDRNLLDSCCYDMCPEKRGQPRYSNRDQARHDGTHHVAYDALQSQQTLGLGGVRIGRSPQVASKGAALNKTILAGRQVTTRYASELGQPFDLFIVARCTCRSLPIPTSQHPAFPAPQLLAQDLLRRRRRLV